MWLKTHRMFLFHSPGGQSHNQAVQQSHDPPDLIRNILSSPLPALSGYRQTLAFLGLKAITPASVLSSGSYFSVCLSVSAFLIVLSHIGFRAHPAPL